MKKIVISLLLLASIVSSYAISPIKFMVTDLKFPEGIEEGLKELRKKQYMGSSCDLMIFDSSLKLTWDNKEVTFFDKTENSNQYITKTSESVVIIELTYVLQYIKSATIRIPDYFEKNMGITMTLKRE